MAEKSRGMGRGLAAILAATPHEEQDELRQIPTDLIGPNPHQPRRTFDDDALLALSESVRSRGVIQPILVRPVAGGRYELIAGERRWRAAQMAQLEAVPAVVHEQDDAASLELAVIENMAREDLNPIEEARACLGLTEELGLTREEVGLRIGRSRVAVSNLLRLLDLPDEVIEILEHGDLSEGHGRALLLAEDNAVRRDLARRAVIAGWSVRDLEARARAAGNVVEPDERPGGRPRRRAASAEIEAAAERISDALGSALGADVSVQGGVRGFTAKLKFRSLNEALAFADRIDAARTSTD